jgi:TetR/AcrR family transcriptional regulator, lmrAB and yxaGH operons repressor
MATRSRPTPEHPTPGNERTPAPLGTRERLVQAMSRALQRRGYHGVGLTELLAAADAPKGVLYHHFPGGKEELAVVAIDATAAHITASLQRLVAARADPLPTLTAWLAMAEQQLVRSNFERGCPLATVALETTAADGPVRAALAQAFMQIRHGLAALLVGGGIAPARANGLAALTVSAYEGALMQARVAGHHQPMADAASALLSLLQSEIDSARAGPAHAAIPAPSKAP